jgi:hypothetical protein
MKRYRITLTTQAIKEYVVSARDEDDAIDAAYERTEREKTLRGWTRGDVEVWIEPQEVPA